MKTRLTKAAAIFAACAALFASCDEKLPDVLVPNFPEKVTAPITAGELLTIEFEPNMAWELNVPEETFEWLWIENEAEETLSSLRGEAGKVSVNLRASARYDLEIRTFDVTLTMGGQTRVIYTLTKQSSERALSVYSAKVDNTSGGLANGSDVGGYEYNVDPIGAAEQVELHFDEINTNFSMVFKAVANFEWALTECPEWVEAVDDAGDFVTAGEAGEVYPVRLKGVPSKYPLDGATGELVFKDTEEDEVFKKVTIKIRPVKNIVAFEMGIVECDAEGKIKDANDEYSKDQANFDLTAVEGVQLFAVQQIDEWYFTVGASNGWVPETSAENQPWVNFSIENTTDTDVLVTKRVSVTVDAADMNRSATVIVLPQSIASNIENPDEDLFDNRQSIKEEYQQYIKGEISQQGAEGGSDDELISVPEGQAAIFEVANPEEEWVAYITCEFSVDKVYQMTVNSAVEIQVNTEKLFAADVNYWGYYDEELSPVTKDNSWFVFDNEAYPQVINVSGSFEGTTEGYILFQKNMMDEGTGESLGVVNVAVLKIVYDPEAEISGGAASVYFQYPEMVQNATLRKMESTEPEYESLATLFYAPYTPDIYVLTYTSIFGDTMAMMETPEYTNWILNNDADTWLSAECQGSSTSVYIDIAEGDENPNKSGAICFRDDNKMTKFIIFCRVEPAE